MRTKSYVLGRRGDSLLQIAGDLLQKLFSPRLTKVELDRALVLGVLKLISLLILGP
jgi:hypothetical protein